MEEKYRIHAFYILSILISIIIGLVTVEWSSIPKLVDYIVFSLTVTSLCLALIAIIYSMQSNVAFSQNMRSLESSANTLSNTSANLSNATGELKEKVNALPNIIQNVSDKLDKTHTLVSNLSGSQPPESVQEIDTEDIPNKLIDNFLALSSFNGLMVIYIYSLSHKTNTPFEYKAALETACVDDDYAFSYTIACRAMGLFSFDIKKNDIWLIPKFNGYLDSNLSKSIDQKISDIGDDMDECMSDALHKVKERVEDFFGIPKE